MSAWALLGVAGVAGLFFSLYRNDVLLGVARSGGWEPRYLAFEARLLGTPGWGTPRSLTTQLQSATPEPAVPAAASAAQAPTAEPALPARAAERVAPAVESGVAASAPSPAPVAAAPAPVAADTAAPAVASPARATSDGVKIVSLDALAALPVEQPPAPRAAAAAPPARRVADNAAPARAVAERAAPAQPVAKAPVAKAPAAPPPARPAAPVAAAPPVNENPLKAAIRTAIVKESQAK